MFTFRIGLQRQMAAVPRSRFSLVKTLLPPSSVEVDQSIQNIEMFVSMAHLSLLQMLEGWQTI
jgi:hypothetical protein